MLLLSWVFLNLSKSVILEIDLFETSSLNFSFLMVVDKISVSFSMVVTLISGSVFLFAHKYMEEDPFKDRFIWILMSFVISMNLLIFSGSLFFILLGWDGLGITSFALIIYYQSDESLKAGFQTLMINRLGDVIIVLSIFLMVCSGQFSIFSMSNTMFYFSGVVGMLCFAALTKSAQFPFSSWLPAAMAAPTPVSALVHSSTLVTAGIFLIIRLSYNFPMNENITSMLLFCGSVTCLLGGWAATYENDIKKVIALSTLSQLGVMVFSLGLNLPSLALFHLYTHALFKALLFLAAGHILMITFGNQDIRLLGGVGLAMPLVSTMFNISSLCLVGAPFMSAFYSKHLILEKMFMSSMNFMSMILMLGATMMTAMYVSRTLKAISWSKTVSPMLSGVAGVFTSFPVLLLGAGGIMGGKLLSSVEINNLELAFIPSGSGSLINIITVTGILLGLVVSMVPKNSFSLSTLFFLTPLVYGSMKVFAPLKKSIGLLDYGWLEPYFFMKNKFYFSGSSLSEVSSWPNSRIFLSCFSFFYFLLIASMYHYQN
uniref:NADH-ubiquinone oxidoreductase chain 5 n=1 Tax=Pleurobranchaea novaezealandiae TaxID=1883448 RepID=A0A1C9M3J8_9GAST|nr:NADH dehydrogenase subunit 5 [Pleurobranchaea novaezealandiae]